jgi:hypothetical protein
MRRPESKIANEVENLCKKPSQQAMSMKTNAQRCFPSPTHLRTETDPASETLLSLVFRIPNYERSPKKPIIPSVIHHRQNPICSTCEFVCDLHKIKILCSTNIRASLVRILHAISDVSFLQVFCSTKLQLLRIFL